MRRAVVNLFKLLFSLVLCTQVSASDWILKPSYYTHKNGHRVTRYSLPEPAIVHIRKPVITGYRYTWDRLQVRNSNDFLYLIERY